jgi:WD40 repeat protein
MSRYNADRVVQVSVNKTPSFSYNNLSCNGTTVAYVHKTEVITFNETAGTGSTNVKETVLKPRLPESKVIQVKWCHLSGRDYLVVGSGAGLVIYDDSVSSSIFVMELSSQDVPFPDPEASFVRGITAIPSTNHICAGSSTGYVFAFKVNKDSIELDRTIKPHEDDDGSATSAMTGIENWGVAAFDSGAIQLYDADKDFQVAARFPGSAPCTSLCITGGCIVAGYTTGQIKLYNLTSKVLFAEIGAHTRAISAINAHPDLSQFVSVGEDSIINVWHISTSATTDESKSSTTEGSDNKVSILFTAKATDSLFTGVTFSRNGSSHLLTSSYDQKKITVFTHR